MNLKAEGAVCSPPGTNVSHLAHYILNPHICCAHTLQVPEVAASPRTMDWGHGQGFAITGLGTVWRACRGPGSGGLSFSWEIVLFSWKQTSPHTHSQ